MDFENLDSSRPWLKVTRARSWGPVGGVWAGWRCLGQQYPGWCQHHDKPPVTSCHSTFNMVLRFFSTSGPGTISHHSLLGFLAIGERLSHMSAPSMKLWLKRRIGPFHHTVAKPILWGAKIASWVMGILFYQATLSYCIKSLKLQL